MKTSCRYNDNNICAAPHLCIQKGCCTGVAPSNLSLYYITGRMCLSVSFCVFVLTNAASARPCSFSV